MIWIITGAIVLLATYFFVDRFLRSFTVGNYEDKYVLVTGCDSGFGQNLAIRLDGLGFHVFAGCLTEDGREYLSKNCSKRLVTVLLDVSKNESIEAALQLVKRILPHDKGLWGLVNNAGIPGNLGVTELCSKEDFLTVIGVNLLGAIEMCRTFLPLIRRAGGRVINTSSICGRIALFGPPYTVSKFGLEGFSDLLRRELYNRSVRVILVEPGGFLTAFMNVDRLTKEAEVAYSRATDDVKTTYGDVVGKLKLGIEKVRRSGSSDLNLVVDAYIHGLTARYPRTRYSVGKDAKFFYLPLSYLPSCITDLLARYK